MRHLFFPFLAALLFLSSCNRTKVAYQEDTQDTEDATVAEIRYEYGIAVDSFDIVKGEVKQGQTLGGILNSLGASKEALSQVSQLDNSLFDPRSLRAGKRWVAFYDKNAANDTTPQLHYWVYCRSAVESVVMDLADSIHIEKQLKEIEHLQRKADVVITSSLWNALVDADIPTALAIELSEIYAWTVDFFGLQQGDRFVALYEELIVDSTSIGIGTISAAAYTNSNRTQYAFRFDSDEIEPDSTMADMPVVKGYFDETGKSLRKTFLKAPLNYKRISSTFTYARKHPIFKTVRPHTGVDYAAPLGTPVVALGDGKVIEKGYKGGGGNTVKIKHNSVYTTAYLHLSKFGKDIEVGKTVEQGQVIGYVGSTGNSTGPHLDFRVWQNGTPVNPLTLESPSAEPIPDVYKHQYDSVINHLRSQM